MSTDALNLSWRQIFRGNTDTVPLSPVGQITTEFGALTPIAFAGGAVPVTFGFNANTSLYEIASTGVSPGVICHLVQEGTNWSAPSLCVVADIGPLAGDSGTAVSAFVGAGIIATASAAGLSAGDGFSVVYDEGNGGRVIYYVIVGGAVATTGIAALTVPGVIQVSAQIVQRQANVYYKIASGDWIWAATVDLTSYFDPRTPALLAVLSPAITVIYQATTSVNRISLSGFQAGYAGYTYGLREIQKVSYEDGTPYIIDDWLYLTADQNYPCATSQQYQIATWGVYRLSLASLRAGAITLEQTGIIYSRRNGRVAMDQNGQLLYDRNLKAWRCWLPSWADWDTSGTTAGGQLRAGTSTADLLHGVHIVDTAAMTLPGVGADNSSYDNWALLLSGTWYYAYTVGTYVSPGVYTFATYLTTSPDLVTFTLVGSGPLGGNAEGTKLWKVNGTTYLAAGNRGATLPYNIYDLSVNLLGQLTVTDFNVPPVVVVPHPALVALPLGAINNPSTPVGTMYVITEFADSRVDATDAPECFGQMVVHQANQTNPTNDYAWIDAGKQASSGSSNMGFSAVVEDYRPLPVAVSGTILLEDSDQRSMIGFLVTSDGNIVGTMLGSAGSSRTVAVVAGQTIDGRWRTLDSTGTTAGLLIAIGSARRI